MIICAAVSYRGRVYSGRHHGNIYGEISNHLFKTAPADKERDQYYGFLDPSQAHEWFFNDKGELLDRQKAAKEAVECKQVSDHVKVLARGLESADLKDCHINLELGAKCAEDLNTKIQSGETTIVPRLTTTTPTNFRHLLKSLEVLDASKNK